ncbi:hypothetical protein E4U43_001028 [Claviceps pusilla]|uniref:Uncharacterized protein n=1 Tax=Claviceps pusilla TaxID=123648 RepID=A0A9P7NAZ9_9HYPO|nr:hypothetical protein E4U43_001028 [Claviceps pusilla]
MKAPQEEGAQQQQGTRPGREKREDNVSVDDADNVTGHSSKAAHVHPTSLGPGLRLRLRLHLQRPSLAVPAPEALPLPATDHQAGHISRQKGCAEGCAG